MALLHPLNSISKRFPVESIHELEPGVLQLVLPAGADVFTPYASAWNADVTLRRTPFVERPWEMMASSSSGAPVAEGGGWLVGLLRPCESAIAWSGALLRVSGPADALFAYPLDDRAWERYLEATGVVHRDAPFGLRPEYCTWVEQVARRTPEVLPGEFLSEALIDELLDVIDAEGWPRGRFTVDEGWAPRHGLGGYGDWEPRRDFDPAAVAARIAARGHVPGLWVAPVLLSPESAMAKRFPDLAGPHVSMPGETPWNAFRFLEPSEESQDLINQLFRRIWDWGYRKLKLDIFYGRRDTMLELSRQCRVAADLLPGPVELEGHIPDPLIAQYYDVIRLNDVMISPAHPDWMDVVNSHDRVCAASCPNHVLCLDHLGGNNPRVGIGDFKSHARWMAQRLDRGYPVVGLLPSRLGPEAVAATSRLLAACGTAESRISYDGGLVK